MPTPHAGLEVEDIEGLAGKAMGVALTRMSIRLDRRRRDDLLEYLVGLGYEMAATYDPDVGQAFSTYYYRRARRRVIDWLRHTHGDSRYGAALAKLPITYPESLHAIPDEAADSRFLTTEDPQPDSLADAIVELGRDLSPDARWALVNVAGRVAEGATEWVALRESRNGVSKAEARRRFEVLRDELGAYRA